MSTTLYNQYVKKGRQLVRDHKMIKYDLCILTLKVCDIQHGGHTNGSGLYSIKKFANDIDMNYDTLKKWLQEHRNVVEKITTKPPKAEDYKIIRQVMKDVTNKTSKKEVRKIYDKYKGYTKEDHKLLRMIMDAKIIRNFCNEHIMSSLNKQDVDILLDVLEQSVKTIKKSRKVVLKKGAKVVAKTRKV